MITLTVTICMAFSLAAFALADNSCSMDKQEKESELAYTFGDLAAARFAVYGILDRQYRTPQKETAEPLSRLEAIRLLWNAFADDTVLGAASEKNAPGEQRKKSGCPLQRDSSGGERRYRRKSRYDNFCGRSH